MSYQTYDVAIRFTLHHDEDIGEMRGETKDVLIQARYRFLRSHISQVCLGELCMAAIKRWLSYLELLCLANMSVHLSRSLESVNRG